jgi:uncharacterized protein YhaN
MRFSELHLIKYGQFDDCRLDLPVGTPDLQIIFGPNETGKSTTMSAVADLLFGFTHVAAFDFRFDKLLLRVGGIIESGDGAFVCRRKRGNVRTLLDASDQPIDEGRLATLLGGQSRESFLRMFSLDHERLRDGGRAILDAKDDVGQAIFAAGSGLVGIVRLVETLDEEAKAIWSERASVNRAYYVAQRTFDEARSRLRESQVKSAHWADLKKDLDAIQAELETLRTRRGLLQTSWQSIERRRRVLAPIARRTHLQAELEALGPVPELGANAATVLETALARISEAETTAKLACDQRQLAEKQLEGLTFNPSLLQRKAAIMGLRAQKGAVDKAVQDTPRLRARADAASEQLRRLQSEIGWPEEKAKDVQRRLPGRPQLAELRQLLEQRSVLDSAEETAQNEVALHIEEHETLNKAFASLPKVVDQSPLVATLQVVRSHGDLASALRSENLKLEKSKAATQVALAALAPWQGDAVALASISLIDESEATRLTNCLRLAEDRLDEERRASRTAQDEQARRDLQRNQLLRDEHAISTEMLGMARQQRDESWVALRDHVLDRAALVDPAATAAQFTADLSAADQMADRRFEAAETSASLTAIDEDLERLALTLGQTEERISRAQAELMTAQASWLAAVSPAHPILSPSALESWRARRVRALELTEAVRTDEAELTATSELAASARAALLKVLPVGTSEAFDTNAPLAVLIKAAERLETDMSDGRQRRATVEAKITFAADTLSRAEARRRDVHERISDWNERWARAVTVAGLDAQVSIPVIRVRLQLVDELRTAMDTILGYEQRIADMETDISVFTEGVRMLAEQCQLVDVSREPALVLQDLEGELEAAATLAERAAGLRLQIEATNTKEREAGDAIAAAEASLSPLLVAAAVSQLDEIGPVIVRLEQAKVLRTQIDDLTATILDSGDGLTLDELLAEAADGEPGPLASQSETLREQLAELAAAIEGLAEKRQAAQTRFSEANERPDSTIAAADLAQAKAEMEIQAEAYVRKRAETTLLRWTVDRYRREKQAPLLQRASAIFSTLTLGRYSALMVDIDGTTTRLSAISADGTDLVPVSGMSEGTIDQLYLALRLSAVEESLAAGVALPFLADDLFINYDDERAAAGFQVLAKLAQKTQVLFFTHHEHLISVARAALEPVNVSTCRIGDFSLAV